MKITIFWNDDRFGQKTVYTDVKRFDNAYEILTVVFINGTFLDLSLSDVAHFEGSVA